MKKPARFSIALVLTIIYVAITVCPLAPLAFCSKIIAHAITGESSGDCNICGCSAERRANHTCCCWQKKLKQQCDHDEQSNQAADCCKKKQSHKTTAITSNCQCGSGKQLVFTGSVRYEVLPNNFAEEEFSPPDNSLPHNTPRRFTTRHIEPPDPPPKILIFS